MKHTLTTPLNVLPWKTKITAILLTFVLTFILGTLAQAAWLTYHD